MHTPPKSIYPSLETKSSMFLSPRSTASLLAIVLTLIPSSSEAKPMIPCTASIEPALTATVTDARTNKPLDATIVAKEGKFQEKLEPFGATATGQTIYGGVFERPGVYTVMASKPGYQALVMTAVRVTKNECHVQTRNLMIRLKPR